MAAGVTSVAANPTAIRAAAAPAASAGELGDEAREPAGIGRPVSGAAGSICCEAGGATAGAAAADPATGSHGDSTACASLCGSAIACHRVTCAGTDRRREHFGRRASGDGGKTAGCADAKHEHAHHAGRPPATGFAGASSAPARHATQCGCCACGPGSVTDAETSP